MVGLISKDCYLWRNPQSSAEINH